MTSSAIDYDVHGFAGVRLVGARAADAAVVDRQLGGLRAPLAREPDVVVRFVERLEVSGPVRLLGAGEAGFTDDAFLLLRSRHKARARVRVEVDRIGRGCEIVVERGVSAVPLLVAIVNLSALANGALALHASAFAYRGRGVVTTGWSKGGKTEALLAFMPRGARYVADEWLYVAPDGASVHGLPEPIRLWSWHLRQLPWLRSRVGARDLAPLPALHAAARAAGRRAAGRRLAALLERQLHVDVAPSRLFEPDEVELSAGFDRLFLMRSWERPDVRVSAVDGTEVAARMAFSLQHERASLTACYQRFRFAFPDRANPLLEEAPARERELLDRVLGGRTAYAVDHPYPVRLDALFEAMRPYC
jgi:hypothetical protein